MGDLVPAVVDERKCWADLLNICDSVEDGEAAANGDDVVEYIFDRRWLPIRVKTSL